jgi:hypothetical protein
MFCLARENVLLLMWGGLGRFDWLRLLEWSSRLQEREICVAADELMYLGMHLDAMVVGAKSLHRTFRGERCCTSHEHRSIVLLAPFKGLQHP